MLTLLLLAVSPTFASPWCGTLGRLALHPARADRDPAPPPERPRSAATQVCIEPQGLADDEGFDGVFDQTRTSAHYVLAWDAANSAIVDGTIDTYESALEASWEAEVENLGWSAPDETDTCLMTVLITEFPTSWGDTGGYTNVLQTGTVPFMVLNTDWLQYGDIWTQTLVAHEFNHASQFSYDVFWEESDWWYWESTAEWVPDEVYDDADTYIWSLWSYLYAPELGLESTEEYVDYGHFAFNTVLAEQLSADAVRQIWAAAGPDDGVREAIDAGLAGDGVTFEDAVLSYTSHVAAIDVQERDVWLDALGYFDVDPWQAHAGYPAEGSNDGATAPAELGQNFVHLDGPPAGGVQFDFSGDEEAGGAPTAWAITIASVAASGAVTHEVAYADGAGQASVVLAGTAADEGEVTEVYIAVIPMGAIGTKNAGWSFTAVAEVYDDIEVVYPDEKACGCGATSPGNGGLLGLGLGLTVLGRRKRLGTTAGGHR